MKAHDYFALSDQQRRRRGLPRVDTNLYARENGWAIEALALFAAVADRPEVLDRAVAAAEWVLANREVPGGGFRHGQGNALFLGDTLACGQAFLTLYQVTGQREWLERAIRAADFIDREFRQSGRDGLLTAQDSDYRHRDENISAARFANLLYHHTGSQHHRDLALSCLDFFGIEGVTDRFYPGGILLAVQENRTDPLHITVVARPEEESGQALVDQALKSPTRYLRVDRWWPGTPLPPYTAVDYPDLGRPAAFVCGQGRCSAPVFTPGELSELIQ